VLQQVMAERERMAIAQMIFSGREQVVLIRAASGMLTMTMLNYEEQIKKPSEFEDEVPEVTVSPKELELAESLIEASTAKKFDFGQYEDEYTKKLAKMLEAKAAGKKVVAEHRDEEPVVVNLMDALRKSLERTKRGASKGKGHRSGPAKATTRKRATASKS